MRLYQFTVVFLAIGAYLSAGDAVRADEAPPKLNEPLRQELVAMFKADQDAGVETLTALANVGVTLDQPELENDLRVRIVEMTVGLKDRLLRRMHCNRMKAIVKEHGWPGKSLVGEQAAHCAWLIVQHCDHDQPFQKWCLKLIEAMPEGEVQKSDIAYLTDRTLVGDNKPQRYGTQFGPGMVLRPIKDEAGLEARRKEMGLQPLAEYVETAKRFYAAPSQPQPAAKK